MIEKPKKERRFLKTLGKIGEILIQEVLIKIGSNLIKKIGGKKTLPSILFLFASLSLFAQYPATGNKQRLGYQTTGDGLVFRGRTNDTTALKPSTINNAYFILDTVNNVLFNYIKTKGGWVFNNSDTVINNITVDTTSLSNRINLKLNISDTASMLAPYFKDLDTTSLNLTSRFATKLNISDTASMLTNYLQNGAAASTYLPLAGGTTSGLITSSFTNTTNYSTSVTDNNAFTIYNNTTSTNNIYGGLQFLIGTNSGAIPGGPGLAQIYGIRAGGASNPSTDLTFSTKSNVSGVLEKMRIKFDGKVGIGTITPSYLLDVNGTLGVTGATTLSDDLILRTSGGSRFQTAIRHYYEQQSRYAGEIQFLPSGSSGSALAFITNQSGFGQSERMRISESGNIGIGTTTPSATFEVHGSAVFNEGSTDSDFRVESDGNVNMVFVDASTDRVGIGTNAPTKTLEVNGTFNSTGDITEGGNNVLTNLDTASLSSRINGKVSLTGDEYINGQKTFGGLIIPSNGMQLTATGNNSNKLIGINASSFVGEVTLGTGLTLTSNVLNATERYYFDLGIIAGAADNSASTYDFTYGSNIFIVPTSLNGYCIDSVYIRAIGCSTCPPVSPDLDYYVGVYKANAGARVATSGATLVGSQITMNEYDLNEVNRNDTLLTGEAWWVYLNGTYTSDLAYVTAGFIVKKTCN